MGTIKYRATVKVTIDTDDLTARIKQWLGINSQDRSTLVEQTNAVNNALENVKARTVEIETAVSSATTTLGNTQVAEEIKELNKDILYAQKISEGNFILRGN